MNRANLRAMIVLTLLAVCLFTLAPVQAQQQVDQRDVVRTLDPNLPQTPTDINSLNRVLSIAFAFTGALSLLFIVIGGLRYTLSAGDPQGIEAAKNTILWAVIGMVISISAFAIVNFVLERL